MVLSLGAAAAVFVACGESHLQGGGNILDGMPCNQGQGICILDVCSSGGGGAGGS
ncbi:MAG: hypothetical protein R3B72_49055 [Polyangiaceae bacterium]